MAENNDAKNGDLIRRLIAAEEEEALQFFRQSNFASRMQIRFESGQKRKSTLPIRLKPVFVFGVFVLLIATAFLFLPVRHTRPTLISLQALEMFISQVPSLQRPKPIEFKSFRTEENIYPLAESIKKIMTATGQKDIQENMLSEAPAMLKPISRKDLEKKLEIFFKERIIEHFLCLFSNKFTEV